jgi:hypothetical protein
LIGNNNDIFPCKTIKRKAKEVSHDANCFKFVKVSYSKYIMKGVKTKLHKPALIVIAQAEIITRGRDFAPIQLSICPIDYEQHGFTQACQGCT